DATVNALIDVDPAHEAAIELVPLGHSAEAPPQAPSMPRLNLATQAYSFREVDYPLIRQIHEATSLRSPEEVRRFCHAEPSEASVPTDINDIEAVIRRRGSARRF